MNISEFINQILLPLGGTSALLIALAAFLGNVNTKRIINGDLAKHKKELEELKSNNLLKLESIKQEFTQKIEVLKLENTNNLEKLKNKLQTEFLKYETYTSISKEKYQDLFDKRISVYVGFLDLKKEIDDSIVENADYLEFQDDDPRPFTTTISKINEASRENPMLISNELARLSNKLYEKSSRVFSNAKINALYAEMNSHDGTNSDPRAIMEAENDALRKMSNECGELYSKWFEQLEIDVSKIRSILDITNNFLDK